MNEKPRQARSIRAQLLTAMREGEYAHCDRLPRESVLSERLGISRTQLRDILASLDREGFITRRHGVGTVINRHVLGAQAGMDIEVEFMDMIRQSGRTPGLAFVRAAELPADDRIAAKLGTKSVYGFSANAVYACRFGETTFRAYAMPINVTAVLGMMTDNRAVVASGSEIYVVELPT